MRGRGFIASFGALASMAIGCITQDVPIDHAPTAFGGFDRTVLLGQHVTLDARQSVSPDGLVLAYDWSLASRPEGSSATIASPRAVLTEMVPDLAGTYVVALTVSDGVLSSRDLVSIYTRGSSTATTADLLSLQPAVCNVDFGNTSSSSCGTERQGELMMRPLLAHCGGHMRERIAWSFLELPPTVDASLPIDGTFTPPRPGEYWVRAQLIADHGRSPIALASALVFSGGPPARSRPLARIDAPAHAKQHDRILLDGRGTTQGTSTAALDLAWTLLVDPSGGVDQLSSVDTGCEADACRILFPSVSGVYIVTLAVDAGGILGATALQAIEVE
jgi:hypothetical protein